MEIKPAGIFSFHFISTCFILYFLISHHTYTTNLYCNSFLSLSVSFLVLLVKCIYNRTCIRLFYWGTQTQPRYQIFIIAGTYHGGSKPPSTPLKSLLRLGGAAGMWCLSFYRLYSIYSRHPLILQIWTEINIHKGSLFICWYRTSDDMIGDMAMNILHIHNPVSLCTKTGSIY